MIRLALAGAVLIALVAPARPPAARAQSVDEVRVLHITIDSLHPGEVGASTPNLEALRASGTWFTQARAIMAAETLPNHVAMGTGTYAGMSGIPGNDGYVRAGDDAPADPDLGVYGLRRTTSLFEAIEAQCADLQTVGVFSKQYVWRTFSEDPADVMFDQPSFNIPESGHAPESATVPAILAELTSATPPDYLFANLGDVDRTGHVGPSGATGQPTERQAALAQTDTAIGTIVETLRSEGLWESTVLVLASDHSMDFSNPLDPSTRVDVAGALTADPTTTGRFDVSENGGAAFVYLRDPGATDRDQLLVEARRVVSALEGTAEVLYRQPNPLDIGGDLAAAHPAWNLHQTERAGDLFVHVQAGHAVGTQTSNPLPGNHGHATTRHVLALVTGGWDGIVTQSIEPSDPSAVDVADDTERLPEQAEQVDYAPTIGWLLGVDDPSTTTAPQWQGRVLDEAFTRQPNPVCVADAAAPPATPIAPAPAPVAQPTAAPTSSLPETGWTPPWAAVLGAVLAGLFLRRRREPNGGLPSDQRSASDFQ